jgi:SpoVK/Ycf46/Vps4 family AAA+-type ATPase
MMPNSALIMEDADTLVVNRKDKNGISFSTMLNVLDGPLRPHGLVCMLTTNHIERFDEAMLRTGRMDDIFHVPAMTKELALEMSQKLLQKHFKSIDNDTSLEIAKKIISISMNPSAISSFLFNNRHNKELLTDPKKVIPAELSKYVKSRKKLTKPVSKSK